MMSPADDANAAWRLDLSAFVVILQLPKPLIFGRSGEMATMTDFGGGFNGSPQHFILMMGWS
jgi:hypothetical protein